MSTYWKHKGALVRRDQGRVGRIGIPYLLLFQVALPLLAPLIDVFTIYGLLFLDPVPVLAYWLGFSALAVGLAAYAFRLDDRVAAPALGDAAAAGRLSPVDVSGGDPVGDQRAAWPATALAAHERTGEVEVVS